MKKIAVMLANGCEEIEALTPIDVLRRAGAECHSVSVCGEYITGSHGIVIKPDLSLSDVDINGYDAIVLPGGMPGAKILGESAAVLDAVKTFDAQGKLIAAICASPAVVLGVNGLICGRKVTCYPADVFINILDDARYVKKDVVADGNLITANGPRSAMEFSLEICKYLGLKPEF